MEETKNKYQHLTDTLKFLKEARKSLDQYYILDKADYDSRYNSSEESFKAIGNALKEVCYLAHGNRD